MKKTSRRNFGQQLAGAIAALPVTSLVGSAQKRKPRGLGQIRPKQSSPITVGGGGSVGIDFSTDYYKRVGGTNMYRGPQGDKLHKLWVTDKFGAKMDRTPGSVRSRIVIHCVAVDPAGMPIPNTDKPITVYGSPLAIEVDLSDYEFLTPEGGSKDIYYNAQRKLTGNIEVYVGNAPQPLPHAVPTGGNCIIDFLNTY